MNPKESQISKNDTYKLCAAGAIVLFGLVGFYYFSDYLTVVRVIGLLIAVGAAVAISINTEPGQQLVGFLQEARSELRKVVWPTRAETLQTTLAVFAMVVVMGLFLWMFDWLLFAIVRFLTG